MGLTAAVLTRFVRFTEASRWSRSDSTVEAADPATQPPGIAGWLVGFNPFHQSEEAAYPANLPDFYGLIRLERFSPLQRSGHVIGVKVKDGAYVLILVDEVGAVVHNAARPSNDWLTGAFNQQESIDPDQGEPAKGG